MTSIDHRGPNVLNLIVRPMPLNLCLLSLTAPESTPVVLQLGFVIVIAMVPGIHLVEAYLHKPAIQSALLQLILLPTAPKAILVVLQLGFVIATMSGIHFLEAYLPNPAIY